MAKRKGGICCEHGNRSSTDQIVRVQFEIYYNCRWSVSTELWSHAIRNGSWSDRGWMERRSAMKKFQHRRHTKLKTKEKLILNEEKTTLGRPRRIVFTGDVGDRQSKMSCYRDTSYDKARLNRPETRQWSSSGSWSLYVRIQGYITLCRTGLGNAKRRDTIISKSLRHSIIPWRM